MARNRVEFLRSSATSGSGTFTIRINEKERTYGNNDIGIEAANKDLKRIGSSARMRAGGILGSNS